MIEVAIRGNKAGTTILPMEQLVQEAREIFHCCQAAQAGRIGGL
jgi:hypothetical protein